MTTPHRGALGAFLDSGATYWSAMLLVGVLNLGFNVIAAQHLGPVAYGDLAAVLALINLFLVAIGAVTRTVTAIVARLEDLAVSAWLLRSGSVWMTLIGTAAVILVGSLARPVAALLHLDDPAWVWIAAVALVPGHTGAITTGILQGLRLFRQSGGVNLAGAAVKFGALLLLLHAGLGVTGGALASLAEVTIIWGGAYLVLIPLLRRLHPRRLDLAADYRELLALPVALTVARMLFFNLDILMARHYLSAQDAGLFAALGVTGRIIAYGTGALPPVIYPYLVRYRADHSLMAKYLGLALAATALCGGGVIAVFYLAPNVIVGALFGAAFAQIAPFVGWYGVAFLLYALTYVLLHYLLAEETWWVWVYALGGGMLEAAALVVFHAGIAQFTEVVTACFALIFVITAAHAAVYVLRPPKRSLQAVPA